MLQYVAVFVPEHIPEIIGIPPMLRGWREKEEGIRIKHVEIQHVCKG